MTTTEFSNEFDVLYNNISSNQAPGLNEYEKSVFLTKAQSEILKNYFNPKGNKYEQGFDESAKRQIDFSSLIKMESFRPKEEINGIIKFDSGSPETVNDVSIVHPSTTLTPLTLHSKGIVFDVPTNILFIINEFVRDMGTDKQFTIIPINYEEFNRLMSKPYKLPLKNQGWRILQTNSSLYSEIILPENLASPRYIVRYVKKPKPIILADFSDSGVSIEGMNKPSGDVCCELDPILHPEILQRAVELAKAAYIGDLNSSLETGKRSE